MSILCQNSIKGKRLKIKGKRKRQNIEEQINLYEVQKEFRRTLNRILCKHN